MRREARNLFALPLTGVKVNLPHLCGDRTHCILRLRGEHLGQRCLFRHSVREVRAFRRLCQYTLIISSSTNNRNVIEETDEVYDFPPDSLIRDGDNVLTIVQVRSRLS